MNLFGYFGYGLELFTALCLLGVIFSLIAKPAHSPKIIAWFGALAALVVSALGVTALFASTKFTVTLWTIPPLGNVVLHADALTGLFLLVTGLVFLPASVYVANSLPDLGSRHNLRAYAVLIFSLMISIVVIFVSGDVFSFLVAWEIMSALCYLLVNFAHEDATDPRSGYLMVAIGEAGALAAAIGLLLLAAHAGTLDFAGLKASASTFGASACWAFFLLTFFGFGVKAGLVPVNTWLPGAYTAAPSAFVPVLAGATLNLGLYGIFRFNADILPVSSIGPGILALIIGTISAFVGILYATTENDLKTLFAHSSVENAGIITVGFGMGFIFMAAGRSSLAGVAFLVGLYHLVNHSFYKTLLFIGAGVVSRSSGTRDLNRLGGLIRRMPWTALFVLAGVLGIAAMPPFNGFVSEWLTLQTFLRSAELSSVGVKIVFALCGAGLALTVALAATCFVKLYAMGFLGMTRSPEADAAKETSVTALAPMAFLAAGCLLLGVLPTYVIGALNHAVQPITQSSAATMLVPPFFAGSAGHRQLPADFAKSLHDIGSQVGEGVAPGPGLVILHRGGKTNPIVFAASPTYLILVLIALLVVLFVVVRLTTARRKKIRRVCWDGGIRRLQPEMTYTATGFAQPVAVIFETIFRPKLVKHSQQMLAEHFRAVIHRETKTIYIVDRLLLQPVRRMAENIANLLAHIHHGRLNVYLAYVLGALIVALLLTHFL